MEVDEEIPQNERIRENQVQNNAGGYVWKVDDMKRLRRFLVLGSENPTYYVEDRQLGRDNASSILNLLRTGGGLEVVKEIRKFSEEGRTTKQNPIMVALAMCVRFGDLPTKQHAAPRKGWGRAHRRSIRKWYTSKPPMKLAVDITKYQKREGWSHKDIAKLMHLRPVGVNVPDELECIMMYIVQGWDKTRQHYFPDNNLAGHRGVGQGVNDVLYFLRAVEEIKTFRAGDEGRVIDHILTYNLVREHLPTQFLQLREVWRALLKKMPMTAMIRNLGKMTSVCLLEGNAPEVLHVSDRLRDVTSLKIARIHPFNVLVALKIYCSGHGEKGKLSWTPNETICHALEEAFYLSFKNVQPTEKRYLLAIDVSGSMTWGGCAGSPSITPSVASAAMAMVTARTERSHKFLAFSNTIVPVDINETMRLEDVIQTIQQISFGGTDCALPMTYAMAMGLQIDVFIVYTDCETRAGSIHPSRALQQYREHSQIKDAKLIVVAMTSNGFTIADPDDPGMLDVVGFDSAAPQVMREFILGNI